MPRRMSVTPQARKTRAPGGGPIIGRAAPRAPGAARRRRHPRRAAAPSRRQHHFDARGAPCRAFRGRRPRRHRRVLRQGGLREGGQRHRHGAEFATHHLPPPRVEQARGEAPAPDHLRRRHAGLHRLNDDHAFLVRRPPPPALAAGDHLDHLVAPRLASSLATSPMTGLGRLRLDRQHHLRRTSPDNTASAARRFARCGHDACDYPQTRRAAVALLAAARDRRAVADLMKVDAKGRGRCIMACLGWPLRSSPAAWQ